MNLIENSTFQTDIGGTLYLPTVSYGGGTITVTKESLGKGLPPNYMTLLQAVSETGVYFDIPVDPTSAYTFSFYTKNVIGNKLFFAITDERFGLALKSGSLDTSEQLIRYDDHFITGPRSESIRLKLYEPVGSGYSAKIAAVQFEEGFQATSFLISLAPILTVDV